MLNATRVRKAKNVYIYIHTYLYLFLYLSLHIDNMSLQSCHEFHSNAIVFIRPFTLSYLYSPSPVVRRLPSRIHRNLLICSTFLYVDRLQILPGSCVTQNLPSVVFTPARLPCIYAPMPSLNQQSGS